MLPTAKDKPLFTPGPLTTSLSIKQAMLRDLGSRDFEFIETIRHVREGLLKAAGVSREGGYEAVLMQGSGTFGIEATIGSAVPPDGKVMVIVNGAYGQRIARMCDVLRIEKHVLDWPEDQTPDPDRIDRALAADPDITHIAIVHCETTTGIMNPIDEVGEISRKHGKVYLVDSMSAFGAVEFDLEECCIDFLVSSANKCIEGVPGFSFVVCKRASLEATAGYARSLSLDLLAQWKGLESNGQFRFTPPTHTILAFAQALRELELEGGPAGRAARYKANHRVITQGMRKMGFEEYLRPDLQGHIITSFRYPADPKFHFENFYAKLNDKGYVIYPGKVSNADCFRIGHIGRLFEADMRALLGAIRETLAEMGITLQPAGAAV